ncbi:MAG: HAMP domain-containing histidine kinase [Akkermansiaceae bacterium]|nr:HAMP domain-containing histidine kinase [Akkermansiaceae bacterium]
MSGSHRFPLLAKVLGWLLVHLVLLGLGFFLFVRWQLGLGLESLISGAAGERLAAFGEQVVAEVGSMPPVEAEETVARMAAQKGLGAVLVHHPADLRFPGDVPKNVVERVRGFRPPRRPGPPGRPIFGPGRRPPGEELPPPEAEETEADAAMPVSKPIFLVRGDGGDGYWAGVVLRLESRRGSYRPPALLLVRSDRIGGSGMFFDFTPWLWGGLAVLALSLAFWTPFVWSITRYVRRLTGATEQIAAGRFDVSLPPRGGDELASLGHAIEAMADRLDHFVSGQKRFLGDAAHELCAPLARIRTALGILEMKPDNPAMLESVQADTAELAALVDELLAFSRAGNRKPALERVELEPLVRETVAREANGEPVGIAVPPGLAVTADARLLGRAIGNLVRNSLVHAGPDAHVSVAARSAGEDVLITVSDKGPGIPREDLARVFEPFYRLDRSRSRDTGGTGLGLAIVRTAVEACGGSVEASLPESGGLTVEIRLPEKR